MRPMYFTLVWSGCSIAAVYLLHNFNPCSRQTSTLNTRYNYYIMIADPRINIDLVMPTRSDSDFMFCLQIIGDVLSTGRLCVGPVLRIGLTHE